MYHSNKSKFISLHFRIRAIPDDCINDESITFSIVTMSHLIQSSITRFLLQQADSFPRIDIKESQIQLISNKDIR